MDDEGTKTPRNPLLGSGASTLPTMPSDTSKLHVPLAALCLAVLYALCLIAPMAALAQYLLVMNRLTIDPSDRLYAFSTAPATRLTTFTGISSSTMKWFVGPSASILAWFVAGRWARSNQLWRTTGRGESQPRNSPTPAQLSILQYAFLTTGVTALFDAIAYSLRLTSWSRKLRSKETSLPSYFKTSIVLLLIMLLLTYICTALDLAFHLTTKSSLVPTAAPLGPPGLLGRSFNTSSDLLDDLFLGPGTDDHRTGPRTLRVRSNTSSESWAAWTDKSTAVLTAPMSIAFPYSARSLALRVSCESISEECINNEGTMGTIGPLLCVGPHRANLSAVNTIDSDYETFLDSDGQVVKANELTSNPFPFAAVVHSRTYSGSSRDTGFQGASGSRSFAPTSWNALLCQAELGEAVFTYEPPSNYTESSFVRAGQAETTLFRGIVYSGSLALEIPLPVTGGIASSIDGVGFLPDSEPYSSAFERGLAKNLVSFASLMAIPESSSVELLGSKVLGSRFLWPVLLAYFACVAILAILTLLVGALAVCGATSRSIFVRPLHLYLTSTAATVVQAMGEPNPSTKAQLGTEKMELFAREDEGQRLVLRQTWLGDSALGVVVTMQQEDEKQVTTP